MEVAVIGAGVSGLAALKWLRAEGISATAIEKRPSLGGLWNLPSEDTANGTAAYPGLSMNTSRQISGFSDYPYPASDGFFPKREEVIGYLKSYALEMELTKHFQLGTCVDRALIQGDGRWCLSLVSDGVRSNRRFDKLVVCTGRHEYPHLPNHPGAARFSGEILHSHDYTSPETFRNQAVLVVGSGASAADLAVQLSHVCRAVFVSVKGGRWILPRLVNGRPLDHKLSRLFFFLPAPLQTFSMRRALMHELGQLGISEGGRAIGLPVPELDLRRIRLTMNTEFLVAVRDGAIQIKPEIAQLADRRVEFTDGTRERIDTLISATGYEIRFPFLDFQHFSSAQGDLCLYNYVFPLDVEHLAFIGMVNVQGPFLPAFEMQARWLARVFAGKLALPCHETMRGDVEHRQRLLKETGARSNLVPFFEYTEKLAELVGVRPRLLRHPQLLKSLLFGPVCGTQYRLSGPHRWKEAASVISAGSR